MLCHDFPSILSNRRLLQKMFQDAYAPSPSRLFFRIFFSGNNSSLCIFHQHSPCTCRPVGAFLLVQGNALLLNCHFLTIANAQGRAHAANVYPFHQCDGDDSAFVGSRDRVLIGVPSFHLHMLDWSTCIGLGIWWPK